MLLAPNLNLLLTFNIPKTEHKLKHEAWFEKLEKYYLNLCTFKTKNSYNTVNTMFLT